MNTLHIQEQEYLKENIFQTNILYNTNYTISHQAAELKTKSKQLQVLLTRNSVRTKPLRSREVVYEQRKCHH